MLGRGSRRQRGQVPEEVDQWQVERASYAPDLAVKAERKIPGLVAGKVPRQHKETYPDRLAHLQWTIPQHPKLGVKRTVGWGGHLDDQAFEQGAEP